MKKQHIFRNASPRGHTTIANTLLNCPEISIECIGFLAAILALPPVWVFHFDWALSRFNIGKAKLKRIIREAKDSGFMKVDPQREGGKFTGLTEYFFTDTPNDFSNITVGSETAPTENTVGSETAPTENTVRSKTAPTENTVGSETAPTENTVGSETAPTENKYKHEAQYIVEKYDESSFLTQDVVSVTVGSKKPHAVKSAPHIKNLQKVESTTLEAREPLSIEKKEKVQPSAKQAYDALHDELMEAGGDALNAAHPALFVLSDPIRWIAQGCDLQSDVLPVIRAKTIGKPNGKIKSWGYFTEAVFEARDKRLAPGPEKLGRMNGASKLPAATPPPPAPLDPAEAARFRQELQDERDKAEEAEEAAWQAKVELDKAQDETSLKNLRSVLASASSADEMDRIWRRITKGDHHPFVRVFDRARKAYSEARAAVTTCGASPDV